MVREKRGAISGRYVNSVQETVWLVAWAHGRGYEEVKSEKIFELGQIVRMTAEGALVQLGEPAATAE